MPRHVGLAATVAFFAAVGTVGVIKGGHLGVCTEFLDNLRNDAANAAGFRIASVTINGRKQLTHDEVLSIGGVTGRSSLLFLDAAGVRDRLKANPWVADAAVVKFQPGRLQIDIVERQAFAIWQRNGRLAVIADDGVVLETYVARRFANLPLVVGQGAQTKARDLVALLDRYPAIRAQTQAAVLVGERRWNLRLKDGLDVRLPEQNPEGALATLTRLDTDDQIFARDIVAVDLRIADRVTVRLSEDAAKAREEQFNSKKPKRKGTDT